MRPLVALLLLALAAPAAAQTVDVKDDAGLRAALRDLRPGVTVRLAPGTYRGGLFVEGRKGTAERPIVLRGADPERPPVIEGGGTGLHLAACEHVHVSDLVVRGATDNGVNVDDGGSLDVPARGIRLERLRIERVAPTGNHDLLKLSGLDDLVVRDCAFSGWSGSAIDMVGCHDVLIEGCRMEGLEGFEQSSGVQCKGGTMRATIRRCTFRGAIDRGVNAGGSTGLQYFRPRDADCEARAITVEGCRFEGGASPVAFVGVDGAVVRFCTFARPTRWLLRILQETKGERFVPCRDGRFEDNLVVYRRGDLRAVVNVGPDTRPETFRFARNAWFAEDDPPRSRPDLPTAEVEGTHGLDPRLREDLTSSLPSPRAGADAFRPEPRPRR